MPTQNYYDYKNKEIASSVLGKCIKSCYEELYQKNEDFHNLNDDKIKGHFESTTGKESNNRTLQSMIKTFIQLKNIASFDQVPEILGSQPKNELAVSPTEPPQTSKPKDFVLSHTVVINLPSTTDQKDDVLFKSMKENLL